MFLFNRITLSFTKEREVLRKHSMYGEYNSLGFIEAVPQH